MYVNDPNSYLHRPTRGWSNRVVTVLRSDFTGFDLAVKVTHFTVEGHYLVVRVMVVVLPLYIHNVYAPFDRQEKRQFFSSLVTEEFEDHVTHLVLGNLSTSLNPRLDSSTPHPHYDSGPSSCIKWIAKLVVVDAWRIHADNTRGLSVPLPRKNRLHYMLLSETLSKRCYEDSRHFVQKQQETILITV